MMTFYQHDTAIIDEGARIGEGARIWHFAHICGGAEIGANVSIGQGCFVANRVTIGQNCKIQNNVSVYDDVHLAEDVFCGPSMVFTNVINPRAHIERKSEYLPTYVARGVTFGANCTIVCGVKIGAYAFIGAGAVITKDVPAYALMTGVPARQTGWMSEAGVKLQIAVGDSGQVTCAHNGAIYKVTATSCQVVRDENI